MNHHELSLSRRRAVTAMWIGLVLSVLSAIVPLIEGFATDRFVDHVRDAYPGFTDSEVNADRTAIIVYLVAISAIAAVTWAVLVRATLTDKSWVRQAATTVLVIGAAIALYSIGASGGSYDRIVPIVSGMAGLPPIVAGAAAVYYLWQKEPVRSPVAIR